MLARAERFYLPTLGFEFRCSIQLSYERVRGLDYQTWPDRASRLLSFGPRSPARRACSVAGVPAAGLAEIGRRAPIIIGEGAGHEPRPVIVEVADVVGQPIKVGMMMGPRLRQARRQGQRGQNGSGWGG